MSENYGIESPGAHRQTQHRAPARFLVVIDAGGEQVARLFLATREAAGEFDASTEEVAVMLKGLAPQHVGDAAEWDHALAGHSLSERRRAEVYTLDV
jgi:hypothetical protein